MFFREVIGQDRIKARLIESVKANRVSHAQLFVGRNGTGTLPLALAYAQYVNCHNPSPEDACGVCDSCRKMQHLEHPDLHFSYPFISKKSGGKTVSLDYFAEWKKALLENPYLDYPDWMDILEAENKQGNITAEECRDIIRKLALKPMYEGYKILIMWLPEYLGKEGNMLLKILEEPPENTLFLLVAENEDMILPTILSRTQTLRVPKIQDEILQQALTERLGIDSEEAGRIANLSEGNYNTALALYREGENNYTEEFVSWMRACFKPDMAAILAWVEKMAGTGRENQKNFLSYSIRMFRESLLINQEAGRIGHLLDSEKDFISRFAAQIGPGNIFELNEAFSRAHYHIERNAHPKILFFNLSLQVNELLQRQKRTA